MREVAAVNRNISFPLFCGFAVVFGLLCISFAINNHVGVSIFQAILCGFYVFLAVLYRPCVRTLNADEEPAP